MPLIVCLRYCRRPLVTANIVFIVCLMFKCYRNEVGYQTYQTVCAANPRSFVAVYARFFNFSTDGNTLDNQHLILPLHKSKGDAFSHQGKVFSPFLRPFSLDGRSQPTCSIVVTNRTHKVEYTRLPYKLLFLTRSGIWLGTSQIKHVTFKRASVCDY